jgi:hypothetical protein
MDDVIRQAFAQRGGAGWNPLLGGTLPKASDFTSSILVSRLLLIWGWGLLSAPVVQWLAEGAVMDGLINEHIKQLSKIGDHGLYPGNMRRDLIRMFWPAMKLPQPMCIKIHVRKPRTSLVTKKGHAMINPLEFIDQIYDQYPELFSLMIGRNTKGFWEAVSPQDPKFDNLTDLFTIPNWQETTFPVIIHGDAVQFTTKNKNSLYCMQWKSLLAYGFDLAIILLSCIPKCIRASWFKHDRFDSAIEIWTYIAHFFNAMYSGERPRLDPYGKPWPKDSVEAHNIDKPFLGGKHRIVVWRLTGDLEHHANEFLLSHFNSNFPCSHCCVNRIEGAPLQVTDLARNAEWKKPEHQLSNRDVPTSHPVWSIHGVTRAHAIGDLMHTGEGGVVLYCMGGAMRELTQESTMYEGSTIEKRTSELFNDIQKQYKELNSDSKLNALYPSMFAPDHTGFPCLHAKCAESRHLVPAMCLVLRERGVHNRLDAHRLEAFEQLQRMYRIIAEGDMFLTAREAADILDAVERFLVHYNFLHKYWQSRGKLLYNITIKAHILWHIAYDARYLNPRSAWVYDFEDFVGKIMKCAKACVAGTPMHLISHKVCMNFLLVTELQCKIQMRHI